MTAQNATRWLFVLALCVAAGWGATAQAELILYDPFDGVPGELVTTGGIWSEVGTTLVPRWQFGASSLPVPDGVNLIAPTGNMMMFESDPDNYITQTIRRLRFDFDRIGSHDEPFGVLYMSYLAYHEVSGLHPSDREWAGIEMMSQAGGARTTVYAGKDSRREGFRFETTANGTNMDLGADSYTDGEVRFIVVKFEWDLRQADVDVNSSTPFATGTVWFNPDCLLGEQDNTPAGTANFLLGANAWQGNGFDRIEFNAGAWGAPPEHNLDIVAFDEFRLGTTWDVVTPSAAQLILGDFNGDGVLSGLDIPGFKTALADPDGWAAAHPDRPHPNELGDFNNDNVFSGLDIPGFKTALAGGAAAIPEPATALVLLSAAALVLKRRRSA